MAKEKRKRYDDAFRATALLFLATAGGLEKSGAVEHAAKHLGIAPSTLRGWAKGKNPPPAQLGAEKKGELEALLRGELEGIFQTMPGKRDEANYKDLGVVAGILIDKLQLLQGEPTERTAWTVG